MTTPPNKQTAPQTAKSDDIFIEKALAACEANPDSPLSNVARLNQAIGYTECMLALDLITSEMATPVLNHLEEEISRWEAKARQMGLLL
jgi:hypothetical protein